MDKQSQTPRRETPQDLKTAAAELIIQAEKHKAAVMPTRGNELILDKVDPNNMNHLLDDGSFLHATCHIDATLRAKIQRGAYVQLEKLLQKHKSQKRYSDKGRVLMDKGGEARFVDLEDTVVISNIRKWEQAFRIYATIYSQANPDRAAEILQYINTVNSAARSFTWECVEYYDYTFRHLMEDKPNRSWARTFPELWNLSMVEPISKSHTHNPNSGKKKDWRDGCCWKFNKSHCPYGSACRFEHKCTYCGSTSHPLKHCYRKNRNNGHSDRGRSQDGERRSERNEVQNHKDRKNKSKKPASSVGDHE